MYLIFFLPAADCVPAIYLFFCLSVIRNQCHPREMLWGGRWEGASCLGTHVRIKDFKIKKKTNENYKHFMIVFLKSIYTCMYI